MEQASAVDIKGYTENDSLYQSVLSELWLTTELCLGVNKFSRVVRTEGKGIRGG